MAKAFVRRRTPYGEAVLASTINHVLRLECAAGQRGRDDVNDPQARLILAAMYCVVEDYEKAEPLLKGNLKAAKRKKTANPEELFWACFLLAEAYFVMNRIPEALALAHKAKPISRAIDPSAKDPILGGLWRLAFSFEANRDSQGRQKGFAAALMALSWSMTRGLYRSHADSPVLDHLRFFLTSYGIGDKKWNWTVKHAHLTRYDFVGLLSILVHYTGLSYGAGWRPQQGNGNV